MISVRLLYNDDNSQQGTKTLIILELYAIKVTLFKHRSEEQGQVKVTNAKSGKVPTRGALQFTLSKIRESRRVCSAVAWSTAGSSQSSKVTIAHQQLQRQR